MILPRIKVNRLLVLTNQNLVAYDESFHSGINIIRGENSSGKSTIMQLLFFALGGAFKSFVREAKKCRDVYVELYLNEVVYTFCRRIETNKDIVNDKVGMEIHWGDLNDALSRKCKMEFYGYNSTATKQSYSNIIFELLGIPEIKENSNITMHQILRLMYIDQDSPTSSLFYYDQFDNAIQREAIADLLLGTYEKDMYALIDQVKDEQKKLESIDSIIKGLQVVLQSKESLNSLNGKIQNNEEEIRKLDLEIENLSIKKEVNPEIDNLGEKLKEEIIQIRQQSFCVKEYIEDLEKEIADTNIFVYELEKKKKNLEESLKTRKYLDSLIFEYCPVCLSKIEEKVEPGHCKLCHNSIDDEHGLVQVNRMILEIGFQIKESKSILIKNNEELEKLQADYSNLMIICKDKKNQLDSYFNNVQSTNNEAIGNCFYKKGLLQGEVLQYKTILEMVQRYDSLKEDKSILKAKIDKIEDRVGAYKRIRDEFRQNIFDKLKRNGIWLLQNDLKSEADFFSAEDFNISFKDNNVYVLKNKSRYSASSNFYLKLAARFSIFLTSLEIPEMRFPRFLFSDNMEDKGMKEERAKNMQRIIVEKLKDYNKEDYQLIFATSMIAEELDNSEYTIGEKYTFTNKSLKNV